jgi:hypothetical protein
MLRGSGLENPSVRLAADSGVVGVLHPRGQVSGAEGAEGEVHEAMKWLVNASR